MTPPKLEEKFRIQHESKLKCMFYALQNVVYNDGDTLTETLSAFDVLTLGLVDGDVSGSIVTASCPISVMGGSE